MNDTLGFEVRLRLLAGKLNAARRHNKRLLEDNVRVRQSRDVWKNRHRECARQNTALRHRVKRLTASRDMWQARSPVKKLRRPSTSNLELSRADIDRILGIPPRD